MLAAINLSFVLSELNRMKEADEWVWQAAALLARAGADFDLEARLATQEGHLLVARSDFPGADVRYRRAWQLRRDNQGSAHPMTVTMLANLATAIAGEGHFEAALPMLKEAAQGFEVAYGAGHFKVGAAHNAVASQQLNLGRPAEALATIDAVLPMQVATLGREHVAVARLLVNRASALERLDRIEEALALNEEALRAFKKAKMPLMVAETHISLGMSKAGLKPDRVNEALSHFKQAREILAATFGEHEELIVAWESEGEVLLSRGRAREALAVFTTSLALREKAGLDDPFCAMSVSGLGRAQKALGKRAAAKTTLSRAVTSLEVSGVSDEALKWSREALADL